MAEERILIVDGDIRLSEMLKTKLESMGYLVDCAHSGREALGILGSTWIDLIVLAVLLQGEMNGYQLFKIIKKDRKISRVPLIMQGAKAGMKWVFESLGADAFFVRPYSTADLYNKIRELLVKRN